MYRVLLAFTYHERAICDEGFGIRALGGGVSDGVFLSANRRVEPHLEIGRCLLSAGIVLPYTLITSSVY
jgi:hypothetical protein